MVSTNKAFLKWFFTWNIALLPFYTILIKDLFTNGALVVHGHNELFIVSIVMVTEPLWELIQIKNKNFITLIAFMVNFLFVIVNVMLLVLSKQIDTPNNPEVAHFAYAVLITGFLLGMLTLMIMPPTENVEIYKKGEGGVKID